MAKECVSNVTAVQKMCRNSRAEAKRILCSAVEKCQQISFTKKKKKQLLHLTKQKPFTLIRDNPNDLHVAELEIIYRLLEEQKQSKIETSFREKKYNTSFYL